MGILSLFSPEVREAARSRKYYAQAEEVLRTKRLSFRQNAIRDILFKYPDAAILLNSLDRRFMVLDKGNKQLLLGKFADDYFPRLDYVSDTASVAERQQVLNAFQLELEKRNGNIGREAKQRFEQGSRWLSDSTSACFREKGYAITGSAELQYIVGGTLFLNGVQIARATIWEPQPKGYFATRILKQVLELAHTRPGTQTLTFYTVDCNPIGEGQKMGYEIMFDRSLLALQPASKKAFLDTIMNLRDFLHCMEDHFRDNAEGADESKVDYAWRQAADCLDSADRDDDQSIESRYLL